MKKIKNNGRFFKFGKRYRKILKYIYSRVFCYKFKLLHEYTVSFLLKDISNINFYVKLLKNRPGLIFVRVSCFLQLIISKYRILATQPYDVPNRLGRVFTRTYLFDID